MVVIAPPPEAFNSPTSLVHSNGWIQDNVNTEGSYSLSDWRTFQVYLIQGRRFCFPKVSFGHFIFQDTATLNIIYQAHDYYVLPQRKMEGTLGCHFNDWPGYDFSKKPAIPCRELKEIPGPDFGPLFSVNQRGYCISRRKWMVVLTRNQYIRIRNLRWKGSFKNTFRPKSYIFPEDQCHKITLAGLALAYER